ncbi:hypothetical protein IWC96_08615, partial [Brevundimonas sp. BAL450]|nr:hypothetical protein [Brevundimonas sp. BAL450]
MNRLILSAAASALMLGACATESPAEAARIIQDATRAAADAASAGLSVAQAPSI